MKTLWGTNGDNNVLSIEDISYNVYVLDFWDVVEKK